MPRIPSCGPDLGPGSLPVWSCPSYPDDPDPVKRLLRLLARSAARDMAIGIADAVVSSFSVAVGSYRP